jgi:hypothetical protein
VALWTKVDPISVRAIALNYGKTMAFPLSLGMEWGFRLVYKSFLYATGRGGQRSSARLAILVERLTDKSTRPPPAGMSDRFGG